MAALWASGLGEPADRPSGLCRQRHRQRHPGHLGHPGAQLQIAEATLAKLRSKEVSDVDWANAGEHVLPPLMHDPVTFAVPFFLLLLIIEWAAARKLAHTETERAPSGAYL